MTLKSALTAALLAAVILPVAAEPCSAVLCLSTVPSAPFQCYPHVEEYFAIRVYTGWPNARFNAPATALARKPLLQACVGARQEDIDRETATYGPIEFSPFTYYVADDKGLPKSN